MAATGTLWNQFISNKETEEEIEKQNQTKLLPSTLKSKSILQKISHCTIIYCSYQNDVHFSVILSIHFTQQKRITNIKRARNSLAQSLD